MPLPLKLYNEIFSYVGEQMLVLLVSHPFYHLVYSLIFQSQNTNIWFLASLEQELENAMVSILSLDGEMICIILLFLP